MDTIREHMEVYGSDGELVGKVDHLEGSNEIKLPRMDLADAITSFQPRGWITSTDTFIFPCRWTK